MTYPEQLLRKVAGVDRDDLLTLYHDAYKELHRALAESRKQLGATLAELHDVKAMLALEIESNAKLNAWWAREVEDRQDADAERLDAALSRMERLRDNSQ